MAIIYVDGSSGSSGSSSYTVQSVTDDTELSGGNLFVEVDCTSKAIQITLPSAVSLDGKVIIITKTDSTANAITIVTSGYPTSDEEINKDSSLVIQFQQNSATLISNGSDWILI